MQELLVWYIEKPSVSLEDVIEFHVRFESNHPFQNGNGRAGRLIIFKKCLKNTIASFIISDNLKVFYYRGICDWQSEKSYLFDTYLTAQDWFR